MRSCTMLSPLTEKRTNLIDWWRSVCAQTTIVTNCGFDRVAKVAQVNFENETKSVELYQNLPTSIEVATQHMHFCVY